VRLELGLELGIGGGSAVGVAELDSGDLAEVVVGVVDDVLAVALAAVAREKARAEAVTVRALGRGEKKC